MKHREDSLEAKVHLRSPRSQQQELQITWTLAQNAVSALLLMDVHGRIVFMNPTAEKSTGYASDKAAGKSLHDLIHHSHPDGSPYPASQCPIESAMRSSSNLRDMEETFITRDGAFFPVSYSLVSLMPLGMKTGAVLEFQDVTERKRSLARLKRSEDRYRRLFETAQDGILILDAEDGMIRDANPFIEALLGYARKELLGKQLWELGVFQDIESNREAFRTLK